MVSIASRERKVTGDQLRGHAVDGENLKARKSGCCEEGLFHLRLVYSDGNGIVFHSRISWTIRRGKKKKGGGIK